MSQRSDTPGHAMTEEQEQWYERETAAFRAWWEAGGEKTYSETPTMAAGAGWLKRAESVAQGVYATNDKRNFEALDLSASSEIAPSTPQGMGAAICAEWKRVDPQGYATHLMKEQMLAPPSAIGPTTTEADRLLKRAIELVLEDWPEDHPEVAGWLKEARQYVR